MQNDPVVDAATLKAELQYAIWWLGKVRYRFEADRQQDDEIWEEFEGRDARNRAEYYDAIRAVVALYKAVQRRCLKLPEALAKASANIVRDEGHFPDRFASMMAEINAADDGPKDL